VGLVVLYQLLLGLGIGFLYSTTVWHVAGSSTLLLLSPNYFDNVKFPVLAPLPLSANGPAVAFVVFLRQFSQVRSPCALIL
jgi:hypothetical protein